MLCDCVYLNIFFDSTVVSCVHMSVTLSIFLFGYYLDNEYGCTIRVRLIYVYILVYNVTKCLMYLAVAENIKCVAHLTEHFE